MLSTLHVSCSVPIMNSFTELLSALGPLEPIADRLGLTVAAVSNMKARNSVLAKHWPALIAMADQAGIAGITYELLVSFSRQSMSHPVAIPATMAAGAADENDNPAAQITTAEMA